ncbi:MAG TPA: ABC transporter permease, partial [Draconibacterium sp.]|nr:ABC transporter permease [Draconibacterium sp.]
MIRIFLLQAIRSLKNQKTHFLVILLGLSVSMASAFLIYSYVFFERSYDSFQSSRNDLYRVVIDAQEEGEDAYKSPYSFSAQGPTALEEVPEVESFTRLIPLSSMVVTADGKTVNEEAFTIDDFYYADDNFFKNFSFPLIQGGADEVLKNSGSVAISKTMAEKLFGSENPVGRNIKIDGQYINT